MKRLFLISIMLMLLGAVYADGPRYRFKSRRALQTLWRKEMKENPNSSAYGRKMTPHEMQGEDADKMEKAEKVYGVVASNPFEDDGIDYAINDGETPSITPKLGSTTFPVYDPNKTDEGIHEKGGSGSSNPYIGGNSYGSSGQGYGATPYPPVGDGLHIMVILTATLIAIKKRLSK